MGQNYAELMDTFSACFRFVQAEIRCASRPVSRGSLGALSPAQLKKSKNGAAPRWAAAAAPKLAGPPMNHPGVAAGAFLPPPGLILDPPTANHGIIVRGHAV